MINVAINGFGRIGRSFLRALFEKKHKNINIVAINDLGSLEQLAHLLKYDTAFGAFQNSIKINTIENQLIIDGNAIPVFQIKDPSTLPWKQLDIDVVLESTGVFLDKDKANQHILAGAKKVLISAPGKNVDLTIVQGVNEDKYDYEKHHIISNASCTTNCLAPIAKLLNDKFGIVSGFMTTIHAFTQDQNLQDAPHKDLRRARCAPYNIVPTSTGAAKSIGQVIPELKGKLDGSSIRVPVITGSMIDLILNLEQETSVEEVNQLVKNESISPRLQGILSYTDDEIVSSDIIKNSSSSIFDAGLTKMINNKLLKIGCWYDNEWGFSNRLIDTIEQMMYIKR
ncbi:type I glyceraldehyde-3-phosphate dehydrogenase [Gallibacterium anatis]|uniref:type I glyceraldehyde-3-phosphate dehydrogenase n=1 Tax=Gallibacterium anatis TaxID=750 RepID=UPI00254F4389|nr:type I glyceraldehyde-3-phosphate dehydrogenase [Gallibacterium anatis]WIM83982.1 type I glyceraldehyde-3-phosphate dehydrogenase [Gallibacterium anatis]